MIYDNIDCLQVPGVGGVRQGRGQPPRASRQPARTLINVMGKYGEAEKGVG